MTTDRFTDRHVFYVYIYIYIYNVISSGQWRTKIMDATNMCFRLTQSLPARMPRLIYGQLFFSQLGPVLTMESDKH